MSKGGRHEAIVGDPESGRGRVCAGGRAVTPPHGTEGSPLEPFSDEEIIAFREDTPGLEHRVHLNSAGASLMPKPVTRTITGYFELEAEIGGYEAADAEADAISRAYEDTAAIVGAPPDRIAMTEHATASFVAALSSVRFRPGDVLVTTRHDYVSNQIQYLALSDRFGVEIVRAPDTPEGGVDLHGMEEIIHRRRPKLVAVTQIPTNSGLV